MDTLQWELVRAVMTQRHNTYYDTTTSTARVDPSPRDKHCAGRVVAISVGTSQCTSGLTCGPAVVLAQRAQQGRKAIPVLFVYAPFLVAPGPEGPCGSTTT